MTSNTSDIPLTLAQTVANAALRRAEALDLKMNVAFVDAGDNLKAFHRMDGAWLGSIDIQQKGQGRTVVFHYGNRRIVTGGATRQTVVLNGTFQ